MQIKAVMLLQNKQTKHESTSLPNDARDVFLRADCTLIM